MNFSEQLNQTCDEIESKLLNNHDNQIKLIISNLKKLLVQKNNAYNPSENPFKNFEVQNAILNIYPEKVILSRSIDKISRINNLLDHDIVTKNLEESIDDTICDLIGYAIILKIYHNEKINGLLPHKITKN